MGNVHALFNIEDPVLPEHIKRTAFTSGGYPYEKALKKKIYQTQLRKLQIELVKLQDHIQRSDKRIVVLFEGRDAAGKGGTIHAFKQYLNPRHTRVIALTKPSETEQGQWYFQRYINHLPAKGEMVLFDRSWYNRAGVEPVMGFCTPQEHEAFLNEVPRFEEILKDDGIHFFKIWLNVGREMQIKRFHDRRHSPLKRWKLSPIDLEALGKWDDYTKVRDTMLKQTHSDKTPWVIVRSNDKKRARLNVIRHILRSINYEDKDSAAIGEIDSNILGSGPQFLSSDQE